LTNVEGARGYGIVALGRFSGTAAELVTLGLVIVLVACVAVVARGDDADRRTFSVAVVGALLVTPLLWLHYFCLLFVPIGLYRPRLSALWFLPLAFWVTASTQPQPVGSLWRISLALAIVGFVTAATVAREPIERVVRRRRRLTGRLQDRQRDSRLERRGAATAAERSLDEAI
jgi:hypothetical protein